MPKLDRLSVKRAEHRSTKSRSNRNQTVTPRNAADSSEEPLRDVGNSEELFDISEVAIKAFGRSKPTARNTIKWEKE